MPSRTARLLAALALHPEGLVVDILLAGMSAPEERRPMLMALRTLERAGLVVRSGDRRHHYIAGVLVRLATTPDKQDYPLPRVLNEDNSVQQAGATPVRALYRNKTAPRSR